MLDTQTAVLALLVAFAIALVARILAPRSSPPTPPTYGRRWLPPFVRGALAAYRLGKDEDQFLLGLRRDYRTAVWLPWPLSQTIVLESEAIRRVYQAPEKTLSFVRHPCRTRFREAELTRSTLAHSFPFAARCKGARSAPHPAYGRTRRSCTARSSQSTRVACPRRT